MKFKELQNKTQAELQKDLAEFQKEAEELTLKIRMGEVKNHQSLKKVRKDIARILTRLTSI
jgi:ribosomal protein L29